MRSELSGSPANPDSACVIVNPTAGGGRAGRQWDQLRKSLPQDWTFVRTHARDETTSLARTAIQQGYSVVVAIGGDGTIHNIMNEILKSGAETNLGVIPLGSANDYASSLRQTPTDGEPGAPWTSSMRVDVGQVWVKESERYFCNVLGIGLPAAIAHRASSLKWVPRAGAYPLAMIPALLWDYRTQFLTLVHDDSKHLVTDSLALSIGLGRREGGFVLSPQANLQDGLFDVLHVRKLTRLKILSHLPGMLFGHLPENDPRIQRFQCATLHITSCDAPLMSHVDGEILTGPHDDCRELSVAILPGRLRVCFL